MPPRLPDTCRYQSPAGWAQNQDSDTDAALQIHPIGELLSHCSCRSARREFRILTMPDEYRDSTDNRARTPKQAADQTSQQTIRKHSESGVAGTPQKGNSHEVFPGS